jgi:RNase H-fold protein (predicted Holliday junction resolvase)
MGRILGLDVSTKTIGMALFESDGKLLELTHITPKIKPQPENKLEELFRKVDAFEKLLTRYMDLDIEKVVIEEPLLNSNNVNTVGTLLRFNGMISKVVDDVLGIIPEFISSYDSRANAFPELMTIRTHDKTGQPYKEKDLKNKKPVLFGAYPWDIDKKQIIWDKVADREPHIVWEYDKNMKLKKENFDMTDAYACGLAWLKINGLLKN